MPSDAVNEPPFRQGGAIDPVEVKFNNIKLVDKNGKESRAYK